MRHLGRLCCLLILPQDGNGCHKIHQQLGCWFRLGLWFPLPSPYPLCSIRAEEAEATIAVIIWSLDASSCCPLAHVLNDILVHLFCVRPCSRQKSGL